MRGRPAVFSDFSGGLNLRESPLDLENNQSPDLADVQPVGDSGSIQRRLGDTVSSNDWAPPVGGAPGVFYSRKLGSLFVPTSDGQLSDGIAPLTVYEGVPAGALNGYYSIIEAPANGGQGPVYYSKPDTPRVMRYWDGAAAGNWTASAGTVPAAHHLIYAGNRVWAARTDADPDALYWSEIGEPRNWPAANITRFGVGDGEVITAIASCPAGILLFKETRAWLIYDLDTSANRPLGAYGNSLHRPIETPYGTVFYDPQRGVSLSDGSRVDHIGQALSPSAPSTISLDGTVIYDLAFRERSLFAAARVLTADGTTISGVFEYRFDTRTWWRHTLPDVRGLTSYGATLYGTRDGVRRLYQIVNSGALGYDGAALAPYWTTKHLALGDSHLAKRIHSVEIVGEGTLTVEGRTNHGTAAAFTRGPFTLGVAAAAARQRIGDLGTGYALQLKLSGTGTDRMRLDELSVRATQRRD
jgi:hypothetical protein